MSFWISRIIFLIAVIAYLVALVTVETARDLIAMLGVGLLVFGPIGLSVFEPDIGKVSK